MAKPTAIDSVLAPVHRQGWPFVAIALVLTALLTWLWSPLFWPGAILSVWVAYFFRDPTRVVPDDPDVVISPADGMICAVEPRVPPAELELGADPLPCISIFMNVFDVHINRAPIAGSVLRRRYRPGRFLNASLDKASEDNERMGWVIETGAGDRIGVVQIAGLIARRIVPFAQEGRTLAAGERIGMIRFGSRCDVYLPLGMAPLVATGQRTLSGETVLADGRRNQPARKGIPR